jgi:hypothetical protein
MTAEPEARAAVLSALSVAVVPEAELTAAAVVAEPVARATIAAILVLVAAAVAAQAWEVQGRHNLAAAAEPAWPMEAVAPVAVAVALAVRGQVVPAPAEPS